MTTFGDVRSAAHAGDREALRQALANYDDEMMPPLGVVAYVKRLDATLWPVTWRGGDGASDEVLRARRHEHPTLSAYIIVGSHEIEVLALEDAEASIQRAMLPIRREVLDLHWMPWAQDNDTNVVCEATRMLYACLDDPTLREAASAAAIAAVMAAVMSPAWDAAWAAASAAAWDAAWAAAGDAAGDAARVAAWDAAWDAAWAKINHRVAVALLRGKP